MAAAAVAVVVIGRQGGMKMEDIFVAKKGIFDKLIVDERNVSSVTIFSG